MLNCSFYRRLNRVPHRFLWSQFYARQQGLCPPKIFEPQHQADTPFNPPMILLYQVIQVFALPNFDTIFLRLARIEASQRRFVGPAFIEGHDLRSPC